MGTSQGGRRTDVRHTTTAFGSKRSGQPALPRSSRKRGLMPSRHRSFEAQASLTSIRPQDHSRSQYASAILRATTFVGALGGTCSPSANRSGIGFSGSGRLGRSVGRGNPLPGVPVGVCEPVSVARIPLISVRPRSAVVRPALSTQPSESSVCEGGGSCSGRERVALRVVTALGPRAGARSHAPRSASTTRACFRARLPVVIRSRGTMYPTVVHPMCRHVASSANTET